MSDEENKEDKNQVNEPSAVYKNSRIVFFNSFEEQEEYNLKYSASLSPLECLQQMRKLIHFAYRMDGVDFENPPTKHKITFL